MGAGHYAYGNYDHITRGTYLGIIWLVIKKPSYKWLTLESFNKKL
jgi:hypothetical protein